MYHIKSDRRSQASALEIVRGMQECLKNTPLKAITVSDIHRATGISRATFYRLFDNPEDVLIYQLDQLTEGALTETGDSRLSAWDLMEETIAQGLQNHEFLRALMDNGRHDLLFRYTEKSLLRLDDRKKIFPEEMDPSERAYIIAHLSMSMVASQIAWDRNDHRDTPSELLHHLKRYSQVLTRLLEE